jgi:hypothetical protein
MYKHIKITNGFCLGPISFPTTNDKSYRMEENNYNKINISNSVDNKKITEGCYCHSLYHYGKYNFLCSYINCNSYNLNDLL